MRKVLNCSIEEPEMVLEAKTFVISAEKEEQQLPLFKLQIQIYSEVSLTFPGAQKHKSMKSKRRASIIVFFSKLRRIILS